MKKVVRIKESNIVGTVVYEGVSQTQVLPNGSSTPITVMNDAVEIIGWVKVIIEFLIQLFKKKDLPTQFMYENKLYRYYSYMEMSGQFVTGYSDISGVENTQFRVFTKTKVKAKNLIRKILKEHKLL